MKIFGKPYAEKFVENLSADAKTSFAAALDDNGDFLRIDLDLGPTALQETYEEDACAKCALSYVGKELQGVICYTSETTYDFVSYEPQDAIRFWEIDAETCELVEVLTHENVTLQDLRIALGSGGGGGGIDPADIPEGEITQGGVVGFNEDDELVRGSLFGKYVRVMDAPSSVMLTPAQIEEMEQGIFINGDFFYHRNPVIFPWRLTNSGTKIGIMIGSRGVGAQTALYSIIPYEITAEGEFRTIGAASQIRFDGATLLMYSGNFVQLTLENGTLKIKEKTFPNYPSSAVGKSFHFVLNDDTLQWHEGNGLYLHTVAFTVSGGGNTMELRFISDSDQPFAHDAQSGNFVNTDATFINLANQHNFVITPFGANGFNPVVYGFNTSTGAFTDVITFSGIISQTVTPIK